MKIKARTAHNKGREAENALEAWLQANGFPDAQRAASKLRDRGDIAGVPGCCIEVKHYSDPMRGLREGQREALVEADGRLPIAVVRLPRVTDPALWWASTPSPAGELAREDKRVQVVLSPPVWPDFVPEGCGYIQLSTQLSTQVDGSSWVVRGDWLVTTVQDLFGELR